MTVGKETITLGNATITADKIVVADRRAANATPTQLTIGEKYRAERAARDAEKARKREDADLQRPMARGEALARLRAVGEFIEGRAALLGNTVFMLNTLVAYLAERGLPVHVGAADETDGGNVLVNRLRADDWEKFYTAKMADENVRLAAEQRKAQIARVDVEGWLKAGADRGLHTPETQPGPTRPVATLGFGSGAKSFEADTREEAVFLAMEYEYNEAAEKAWAEAAAAAGRVAEAVHGKIENGPPCAGQDALAAKVVE